VENRSSRNLRTCFHRHADGAKRKVAELVEGGGLRPLDVGPLVRARQLEQLGLLHIVMQEPMGRGFGSAVRFHAP
jgi:8-hydroxy-5-deazaflavin:NADPH oxidoreductase